MSADPVSVARPLVPVVLNVMPVPEGVAQAAFPLAAMPVANWPPVQPVGEEARAREVVAAIVPEPLTPRLAPVPTTIAAPVLVAEVREEKGGVALMTPLEATILVPSTFATPKTEELDFGTVMAPAVSVMIVPSGLRHPS